MVADYRVKRYYEPRVTIHKDTLLSSMQPDVIVCLTGGEASLLRSLLAYAHRRITWVDEYHKDMYYTPTDSDMDVLLSLVAELETKLMTGTCEDLIAELEEMNGTLAAQAASVATLTEKVSSIEGYTPDVVAALQCICEKDPTLNITATVDPDWRSYPDAEKSFGWGSHLPTFTVPELVDGEACALAQCWWEAGFQLITEYFLPAWRFGYDDLVPAVASAVAFFTGGVTLPVTIGVYALSELLAELFGVAWEAAEANLINWMFTEKQDIVCALYVASRDGGSGSSLWQTVADEIVEPSGDLSAGDKVLVNFMMGVIGGAIARAAQAAESTWYTETPVEGYCDGCPTGEAVFSFEWPPCPAPGWSGTFVCWSGLYCGNHGKYSNYETVLEEPEAGVWDTVTYDLEWTSAKPATWGVGTIAAHYWNGSTWVQMHSPAATFQNVVAAGELNQTTVEIGGFSEPGGRAILFQLLAAGGQYETEPYPIMVSSVTATFSQA